MIRYKVILPEDARERIKRTPPLLKRKIRAALDFLEEDPRAGKPLERELTGLWTYPVSPFRIVYLIESSHRKVQVIGLGHRRDIYDIILRRLYG